MVRAAALRAQRQDGALESIRLGRAADNPLGAGGAKKGLADCKGGDAVEGPLPHMGRARKPSATVGSCCHGRRRSFARDVDLQRCPNSGGELKIIAAILEQPVIEKILTHLGLQARATPRSPMRGQALQES